MGFNRNEDFDSASYVKVNVRLAEFWEKYPEGRIETEHFDRQGVIVLQAKLYRKPEDTHPAATGHAFLTDLDGDKVGEYTETVAVGRALALMGFQVSKSIASAEEMDRWNSRKEAREEASAKQEAAAAPAPAKKAGRFKMSKTEAPKEEQKAEAAPQESPDPTPESPQASAPEEDSDTPTSPPPKLRAAGKFKMPKKTAAKEEAPAEEPKAEPKAAAKLKTEAKEPRSREQLNRVLMNLYRPYLTKFPETRFVNLLQERYNVGETRLMTVEQIEDLVAHMEAGLGQ